MGGTLQSIARIIRDGNLTMTECAQRLGISRDQLENRLFLMERQGYLARQKDPAPGPDCGCGHCCSSCSNGEGAPVPVLYTLTQKGERLAQDSGSA
ncbi:MAG: helix-turn-helix domain-containing protein [Methanoregula sp.]